MKNAFFSLLITIAVTSFFSFTNSKSHPITDSADDEEEDSVTLDTVPQKKDSTKHRPNTVPYDSFGKPKKMDTTHR